MSQGHVIVQGNVTPDGTLKLDQPVQLPAGPVRVTVEPLAQAQEDTWQVLERIWAESKSLGMEPRSAEAIDAEINALRDESEEELRAMERRHDEPR